MISVLYLESLILESNYCFVHRCTIAGEEYLGRVLTSLPSLSHVDRDKLVKKYDWYFRKYQPQGVDMCYEVKHDV